MPCPEHPDSLWSLMKAQGKRKSRMVPPATINGVLNPPYYGCVIEALLCTDTSLHEIVYTPYLVEYSSHGRTKSTTQATRHFNQPDHCAHSIGKENWEDYECCSEEHGRAKAFDAPQQHTGCDKYPICRQQVHKSTMVCSYRAYNFWHWLPQKHIGDSGKQNTQGDHEPWTQAGDLWREGRDCLFAVLVSVDASHQEADNWGEDSLT